MEKILQKFGDRTLKVLLKRVLLPISLSTLAFLSACSEQSQSETPHTQSAKTKVSIDTNRDQTEAASNQEASYEVYLTNFFDNENSIKQESFSCEDKIFAVIEFKHFPEKLQQIEVKWEDPHGELREHNQFPYFTTGETAYAWSSLQLHRSVGAGMLQWINPAAGMEEFIGNWTVSVMVKDKFDEKITFEVLC